MRRTSVVIIGGGQAGLAVSYLLAAASVDHVVLERGRIAESWRSRRWDSLRLLTPNWMSRLPGWSYRGPDPGGFMPADSVADYLSRYAESFAAPVVSDATVRSVRMCGGAFVVESEAGRWIADAVVVATGHCAEPAVPGLARQMSPAILQLTPDRYRNPDDVPDGRVLVVGASATGVQLADELAAAGRDVVLAVGRHTRVPRRYRGMDIMWWLESMGVLDRRATPGDHARLPEPSLQLAGGPDGRDVDLPCLSARGVRVIGRIDGISGGLLTVSNDLHTSMAAADAKLHRLLQRIDDFASAHGLATEIDPPIRPALSSVHDTRAKARVELGTGAIQSVIWATGYRRAYPWLHVPVLDAAGEIRHTLGRTPVDGLTVVGMAWQSRRKSAFLDGVRHDAALVVDHIINVLGNCGARTQAS
jgi:putative flavoprotein involved in K+ transport